MTFFADDRSSQLIGVSLVGPAPVGVVHLNLRAAVLALYGINGAGKSAILRGLQSAFTGVRSEPSGVAALHVRLRSPHDWSGDYVNDRFAESIVEYFEDETSARWGESRWFAKENVEPPDENDTFDILLAKRVALELGEVLDISEDENLDLVHEVSDQLTVTLFAFGSEAPSWRIWISAQIHEQTPRLEALLRNEELKTLLGTERDLPLEGTTPAWVPVPIVACGAGWVDVPRAIGDPSMNLGAATTTLLEHSEEWLAGVEEGSAVLEPEVAKKLKDLSHYAGEFSSTVLRDAPALQLQLRPTHDWLANKPFNWMAFDWPSQEWVDLHRLSQAQERWARLGVLAAIEDSNDSEYVGVVLLDEPESALHARAEREMVIGLKKLSAKLKTPVIIATHSREVLKDPEIILHHVERNVMGSARIVEMTSPLQKELGDERLGIHPADFLQLYRTFLVVEGEHDVVVLDSLIGDQLSQHRAHVIPMRGAKKLDNVIDAQLIFDFTDAAVVVALDRVRVVDLQEAWDNARSQVDEHMAIEALEPIRKADTREAKLLHEFCRKALAAKKDKRIEIFGFSKHDIIMYLPVDALVPEAESWEGLSKEWKQARYSKSGRGAPLFKEWLVARKGATISEQSLREAAQTMDEIPKEFGTLTTLLTTLTSLSQGKDLF